MTLIPWEKGKHLVCATCASLLPSYLPGISASSMGDMGAAADSAKDLKKRKYASLDRVYTCLSLQNFGVIEYLMVGAA